jgi:hypothetical protein
MRWVGVLALAWTVACGGGRLEEGTLPDGGPVAPDGGSPGPDGGAPDGGAPDGGTAGAPDAGPACAAVCFHWVTPPAPAPPGTPGDVVYAD